MSPSKPKSRSASNRGPTGRGQSRSGPKPGGNAQKNASARAKLAAELAAKERRRRRLVMVIVPIAVVLVAIGTLIVVRLTGDRSVAAAPAAAAGDDKVISAVTSVPASVLDQVGLGTVATPPKAISGPPLTADGKPRVLYVGAEYCPYCAAERWAMVVALSRFGTFTGLGQTASSASDVYPKTPTLTFHGSTYTSKTIAFTAVETESSQGTPLDTLSAADQQLFSTYGDNGSIPFVDVGGKYVISGASYSPDVLKGKTHQQVASALSDPSSDIAKAVGGTANVITAAICASTGNAPAGVCSSAGVQAGAKALS